MLLGKLFDFLAEYTPMGTGPGKKIFLNFQVEEDFNNPRASTEDNETGRTGQIEVNNNIFTFKSKYFSIFLFYSA